MKKIPEKIVTWQMLSPHHLERVTVDVPDIKAGEALIEIAGCGICHSDIRTYLKNALSKIRTQAS